MFYKLPNRSLYLHLADIRLNDGEGYAIQKQIDYTLVEQRYRNSFTGVKKYAGADIQSGRNPFEGEYKTKRKIIQRTQKPKCNLSKFKNTLKNQMKKGINDAECSDYRTISLMSHMLKLLIRVIRDALLYLEVLPSAAGI